MTETAGDPRPDLLGGRYRIGDLIGRGGMGAVWAASDEVLHRSVAIKEVLAPNWASEDEKASLCERTQREARAAARISHPNVVTVFDVVEEDGRPWIVMENVASRSLSKVIDEDGPMTPRRVATIGEQILGALAAAHEHGILHRDVKPGNVLICEDDRAVLTDFGIASVDGDSSLTVSGVLVGAPG
ncbi:serine/threonine-protein kinase, partial [Crossiella equi]